MKIQSVPACSSQNKSDLGFKSAFPVIHWVTETNGRYAPAVSEELTRKLQGTLTRLFNKTGAKTAERINLMDRFVPYLSLFDKSYGRKQTVRSYYDINGGWDNNEFHPIAYMLTGEDADVFEKDFGKPIGLSMIEAPLHNGRPQSAELNIAKRNYAEIGISRIKKKSKQFCNLDNIQQALHTKFEVIRSRTGRIKGYKLVDMKFCPQNGPENPFVRTGYVLPEKQS